jgi:hypothetical protein
LCRKHELFRIYPKTQTYNKTKMKKVILLSIALMFAVAISKAQTIPNASFENWTTHGTYETPDNWGSMNNKTATSSVYTCQKAAGTVGTSCMKLTSKTVGANVVNGIAISGMMDSMTMMPKSGFACSGRPANLTGKWQHMIYGSSQGSITITLTRWDAGTKKRITVGTGSVTLSGMAMSWASFSIPISYTDGTNPDSCIIVMMASGASPTNNDYLWVDNLAFSGSVSAINTLEHSINVNVFPNPAKDIISVALLATPNQKISMRILDLTGRELLNFTSVESKSVMELNIGGIANGSYLLEIQANSGHIYKSFVKN